MGSLGELVRLVRPPHNREIGFVSSSFFSFVSRVRAGEAKLRGCVWDVILNAGPSGS